MQTSIHCYVFIPHLIIFYRSTVRQSHKCEKYKNDKSFNGAHRIRKLMENEAKQKKKKKENKEEKDKNDENREIKHVQFY